MNRLASSISISAEQAFRRAAGARLIPGNSARILKDAAENYPAWLEAIESANHTIHFECYIIHEDDQGRVFADALANKAREGVRVRLIYDWMGAFNSTSGKFWRRLRDAGIDVRCFNPPRFDSPFGWLGRDHRKMLVIDGRVGFVSGLCVGLMWVGDLQAGIEPWRDTGIEIRGPAVDELELAFAQMWSACGPPVPPIPKYPFPYAVPLISEDCGVALRIVASMPNLAGIYRLDQIIAAAARETLWLTDAYFAGTTPYVQALSAASRDNVDVRLLVPQASDIPVMRALSRTGYRPLLESGVRVYEWNGPMIHAKTAVADGRWARIGSTNLNPVSWVNNWELDVVIEDERIGEEMEQMFLDDLKNATEMVLTVGRRLAPSLTPRRSGPRQGARLGSGLRASVSGASSSRAAAGAIQIGRTVSAAIANRRPLGPAEARIMWCVGFLLMAASIVAVLWPRAVSLPLAVAGVWVAVSAFIRAFRLRREGRMEGRGFGIDHY